VAKPVNCPKDQPHNSVGLSSPDPSVLTLGFQYMKSSHPLISVDYQQGHLPVRSYPLIRVTAA